MTSSRFDLSQRAAPVIGALLAAAALPGAWLAPKVFFAAWLAAAWFSLGIALGTLTWLWIHRLTGGAWGDTLRAPILRLGERLPRVLLLFVPLAFGLPLLYAAFDPASAATAAPSSAHAFVHAWQSPAFFIVRWILYGAVWLVMARRARTLASSGEAAASLVLHLTLTTLASVDALVALVPGWSSSGFGLLALSGQAFGGLAAVTVLACRQIGRAGGQTKTEGSPLTRDLGNLLLAATLIWAYLAFMQFLIIWAENLPREISFYVPRLQTGWVFAGAALIVWHLAVPFALLLFRSIKDSPRRLGAVAVAMVGAQMLDCVWLVVPSVAPHDAAAWLLSPLLLLGFALLAFGGPGRQPAGSATSTRRASELADVSA